MRIISLTSIPPRFAYLGEVLEGLLAQKADAVHLYIPRSYRRFPDSDIPLPDLPNGIELRYIDQDFGPATKVLPAISEFAAVDAQILFCDDDVIAAPDWASKLFDIQARRPTEAVATLGRLADGYVLKRKNPPLRPVAKQIKLKHDVQYRFERVLARFSDFVPTRRPIVFPGYVDILFGHGGVVVKPDFFDDEAFKVPEESWFVDDIWLSAQLARNQIPIYCPWRLKCPVGSLASKDASLLDLKVEGEDRSAMNRTASLYCQSKFGIW